MLLLTCRKPKAKLQFCSYCTRSVQAATIPHQRLSKVDNSLIFPILCIVGALFSGRFFFFSLQVINEYRNFACRTLAWGCIQAHSLHKSTLVSPSRTVKLPGGYECLPATIHSSKASINSRLTLSKSMTDIVFNTVLLTPGEKENTWLSTSLIKHTCWIHQTTVAAQPASRWDKAEVAS